MSMKWRNLLRLFIWLLMEFGIMSHNLNNSSNVNDRIMFCECPIQVLYIGKLLANVEIIKENRSLIELSQN